MKHTILAAFFFVISSTNVLFGAAPVGDGVTDDADAIQELLDNNRSVYLPPPEKCYLIGKALRLRSDQTLRLDACTTIRLADGAMDYLLRNDDFEKGNRNIRIVGGIWDGNNLAQTCEYHRPGGTWRVPFDPNRYLGCGMMFKNVENLRIEKLTIKDPETFGIHLGNVDRFTVEGITFDYNMRRHNMDGVHVQGGCRHGRIADIKGNTNDDMVALNADDGSMFEITRGPITDIHVDGLFCTNCYRAVRLLSAGHPVKRIRISNIFGSFRHNVVSLTHHNVHPGEPTVFEDILIDGVFSAKQLDPDVKPDPWDENARRSSALFHVQKSALVDNLSIRNLSRREWMDAAAPTFHIENGATVKSLILRDILQVNQSDVPLKFFVNEGTVESLLLDGVVVREMKVDDSNGTIHGSGALKKIQGNIVLEPRNP